MIHYDHLRFKEDLQVASKVYWADLRADYRENLPQKLTRLMKTAGMGQIDFEDKFAAIKLHFGEPGNLAFLRPNWAKAVADFVKERGGKPFLTDCNTLYVGGRKNALDHMDAAMLNAINDVRARAYKTTRDNTNLYPALTMADQNTMRLAIRRERRVEFAWEGRRFFDLLRWGWYEKAYSHDYYACPTKAGMAKLEKDGDYYWPWTPEVDECGFADFKPMFDAGKIIRILPRKYDKRLPLFPIPATEVNISNGIIEQNPGW